MSEGEEKFLVPNLKNLVDIDKHSDAIKSTIHKENLIISSSKEQILLEQLQFINNKISRLRDLTLDLDLLEKKLKDSQKQNIIGHLFDFLIGRRRNIEKNIQTIKINIDKKEKLEKIHKTLNKNYLDSKKIFGEIKNCLDKLEIEEITISLAEFISFNYSVYCDYKYIAKRFEDEPYQDYEIRTRQVEYTKWENRKGSAYIPGKPPSVTRSFSYAEPRNLTRNEEYIVPTTNFREVLKDQRNFSNTLKKRIENKDTEFFALSSEYDNWVNKLDVVQSFINYPSLEEYEKIIDEKYFSQSYDFLKFEVVQNNISSERIRNLWKSQKEKVYFEEFKNPVKKEIDEKIKNTMWTDYDDVIINIDIVENSNKIFCVPFIEQNIKFESTKYKIKTLFKSKNILSSHYYQEISSPENLEKIWAPINLIILENKKLLTQAKQHFLYLPKLSNIQPFIIFLLLMCPFGIIAINLGNRFQYNLSSKCEQEILNLKVSQGCKEYLFKNY